VRSSSHRGHLLLIQETRNFPRRSPLTSLWPDSFEGPVSRSRLARIPRVRIWFDLLLVFCWKEKHTVSRRPLSSNRVTSPRPTDSSVVKPSIDRDTRQWPKGRRETNGDLARRSTCKVGWHVRVPGPRPRLRVRVRPFNWRKLRHRGSLFAGLRPLDLSREGKARANSFLGGGKGHGATMISPSQFWPRYGVASVH